MNIVDILDDPGLARRNRVVATPLLVRERPQPMIKILGDLSQEDKILHQLGLDGFAADSDLSPERLGEGEE